MGLTSWPSCISPACIFLAVFLILSNMPCEAQLSPTFYDDTCPTALTTIRTAVRTAVSRERRMAASLIRLHFHDCFVQGCDASILLDDSSSIQSEKNAPNNLNSVRGYEVIDNIKSKVESICPGVVSCADIVAVAARDASVAVSGPTWTVKLGRRDSTTSGLSLAATNLPSFRDSLDKLVSLFGSKGLSARDMVALSGSHTIGQARCVTFRDRVYNGTDIDAGFASTRRRRCPADNGNGDANLAPLEKGLLQSDQVLFSGGSTDTIVNEYSKSPKTFRSDFASAMVKMGDIEPLTGSAGVIRKFCNVIN
ncbi:lignin-forming anionic peroxidase [Vitis vinifera]|uniref:lignin-forming anionic peroxidase n=1 Tax=Vitis vinifera TaxID=29760 RepID=UPI0028834119|nr:lignin-forming anionic peroxidase [Vitis vinifera]